MRMFYECINLLSGCLAQHRCNLFSNAGLVLCLNYLFFFFLSFLFRYRAALLQFLYLHLFHPKINRKIIVIIHLYDYCLKVQIQSCNHFIWIILYADIV